MSLAKWLSALANRSFVRTNDNRRRGSKSRSRFSGRFMQLEDRRLLAAYVPMLPGSGTVQAQGLSAVVYAPELDPAFNQANLPEAKLVTIMNNGSNVIFPIFQGTNTTPDNTAGTVTRALIDSGGAGYFGQYKVTFSLGSGLNPVAATATADGNGSLYNITLDSPGSGYLPSDEGSVTATITPIGGAPSPTTAAVVSAHVSDITQNGTVSLYDPKDPLTNTYRGYIGETVNGQYQLGLQPGHQVTVQVPIAFWDGGRIYMVDNGPVPLTSQYDPGFPLQANAEWSFNPSLNPDNLAKLGSGRSYIVAPASPGDKPIYGADFADPTTGYANPNGVVMWYHELAYPGIVGKAAAHGFGFGVPAALTEATFRDPKQPFIAPNMRPDQIYYIDNYDVSYVDSLAMPASMEATQVPSTPATPGPSQYAWLGSDLSTTQMQDAIAKFTAQNVNVNSTSPGNPNGLGTYFGGLGWDQFYMPPDNNSTASGAITQINNSNTAAPVTIVTASTAGLVNGGAVTISGVTGQTAINGTWIISNITPNSFALAGLPGDGTASSAGNWTAFKTAGVHLQKLPAGYDSISESPNLNVLSQFDATRYSLVSGGGVESIGSIGTGASTAGTNVITGVSTAIARQLAAGMLLAPANNLAGTQLFPYGTTISRIEIGTAGSNDSTLIMSNKAAASGSPGVDGPGGSWLFFGSQYGTADSDPSLQGKIAANDNKITGLDPKVGMYLRTGMLVTGGGIQTASNTYIKSISSDFTTITLTQNGTSAGGSGPYAFVGSPSSYVLQALINNWYAWADYYVAQLASGPAAAPTGTFAASTRANGGRTDYNSLILDITNPSFDMNQLRVGDVITSALSTTLTPNSTGSPATPGYDPSLNYTIVSFDQTARTVELSLPVKAKTVVADTFTFAPPQYIVRSSDAPAAAPVAITSIGATAGQPFTINTSSTAGLVDGMEVTISGVTDQTTNLSAAVNGRWVITNVTGASFQLQGAGNGNGETLSGGIWSTSAGTIPYTLNFTPPSASITSITNSAGQPIVVTTGSTVGLVDGEQITISGVT
ncbi:MAG TPA: hypothetical protein VHC19_08615, partial [Pirellulales bacterium]|nr:hypothetical protein [Pirellulales bacterium]